MIVECESCHAKFKLDDSKISSKGTKVRCSKCKHVFLVLKGAPVEERVPERRPAEKPPEFDIDRGEAEEFVADSGTVGKEGLRKEIEEFFEPTVKIDLSGQQAVPFEEEAFPKETAVEKPKRKAVGTPVWIAVLVVVVLAALAAVYFYVLPLFTGTSESPVSNLTISNLNGYFEQNVQVPKIFVIEGMVTNESKKPRRFIQVKGVFYNKAGNPAKEQLAYCGNVIAKEDLKTKSPEFIQKSMMTMSGSKGENNLVKPKVSIPFMIVFFALPKEMAEYSVEVANAQVVQ